VKPSRTQAAGRRAGLVAAWAVPLLVRAALAWYRPGWAVRVFAVLTAAVIVVSIWFAVSQRGKGPAEAVLTFALAAAIALFGLKRTAAAGVLLLVVGIVPVAVSSLARGHSAFGSLAAVSLAPVVTGVLYLLSALMTGRPAPSARADTGPGELPKAA
jgi:membrane-bound ClpP family serine protease